MSRKPVIIDLEPKPAKKKQVKPKTVAKTKAPQKVLTPAEAPPVPDVQRPQGQAMQAVARFTARKPSRIARLIWAAVLALIGFVASVAFWDFAVRMMERNPVLGWIAVGLIALVLLGLLLFALRELASFSRLRRIDKLRSTNDALWIDGDLKQSKEHMYKLKSLYSSRKDMRWALAEFEEHKADHLDTPAYLSFSEKTLMTPLDKMAEKEVEIAARQVATATAIVPLALVDILVALTANVRMIRRIAQIYGGRGGTLGSWRLLRAVATHLVATGAVAIGDDMLGSLAGGGVLGKLSRRFGEGLINGALTARVGVAAMEVCRPMAFKALDRPRVTGLVKRALTGLFGTG